MPEEILSMPGGDADSLFDPVVESDLRPHAPLVVVCEHASNRIPALMNALGLTDAQIASHIAWDPGARGVARGLADALGGNLVTGEISRLIYDCNRPPDAPDAMPAISAGEVIPGNHALSYANKRDRIGRVYAPFHHAVETALTMAAPAAPLVTIHSFTRHYKGVDRRVELGILHGDNPQLALAMMACRPADLGFDLRLNAPYSQADGVTHTLDRHGGTDRANVMIEIRSDLIATPAEEAAMAELLAPWITAALASLGRGDAA